MMTRRGRVCALKPPVYVDAWHYRHQRLVYTLSCSVRGRVYVWLRRGCVLS